MVKDERVTEYLAAPYSRVLIPDPSGGYFAEVLELPGCFTQGETAGETMSNLEEAMAGWISAALDSGQAVPEPLALRGYSGHTVVRMPKSLHREAVRRAELEGVSLNQYLVTAIEAHVAGQNVAAEIGARQASRFTTHIRYTQVDVTNLPAEPMTWAPRLLGELREADAANYGVLYGSVRREKQNA